MVFCPSTIPVFVGYDEREHVPYLVTRHTTLKSTPNAHVFPLNHRDLRKAEYFFRSWITDQHGQYYDMLDEKPFSVQFSHSRFLTPFLSKIYTPLAKYAIFYDCDFVVLDDLQKVVDLCEAQGGDKAVYVVKHDFRPENTVKMDNVKQYAYNKKLWSAFMVFNTHHPDVKKLKPELVNSAPGSYLHQFQWTTDDQIGSIPEEWQFIPGHSNSRIKPEDAKILHWTNGGPWFRNLMTTDQADIWMDAYHQFVCESGLNKDLLIYGGSLEYSLGQHA